MKRFLNREKNFRETPIIQPADLLGDLPWDVRFRPDRDWVVHSEFLSGPTSSADRDDGCMSLMPSINREVIPYVYRFQ